MTLVRAAQQLEQWFSEADLPTRGVTVYVDFDDQLIKTKAEVALMYELRQMMPGQKLPSLAGGVTLHGIHFVLTSKQDGDNKIAGAYVRGGHLFFRLLDGSSLSCECIAGPYADKVVEVFRRSSGG